MGVLKQILLFAGVGALGGFVIMIGMGFIFFPTLLGQLNFTGSETDMAILKAVALPTAIAALIGGVIGGQISNEGGRSSQVMMAVILGIVLATPVSCLGFWVTGW
jgi:hypothetical protein